MKLYGLVNCAPMVAALCFATPAFADWMSLKFGQDGPDAVAKLEAFSNIAPDESPLAGRALYGSLARTTATNLQARFEGRFFIAKANFVFAADRLYAVELTPRNIGTNDVLALLVAEYGAPVDIAGLAEGKRDYVWRDERSGNLVLFRIGSTDEPRVIYRPLLTPHTTGF